MADVIGLTSSHYTPHSNCTLQTCPISTSFYNYRISLAPNLFFVIVSILMIPWIFVICMSTRRGVWVFYLLVFGLALQALGFGGRVMSYYDQWDACAWAIQFSSLALGSVFLSTTISACSRRITSVYGILGSDVNKRSQNLVYCDVGSMALQLLDTFMASAAFVMDESLRTAHVVITAGLALQVTTLLTFITLGIGFGLRVHRKIHQVGELVALLQDPQMIATRRSKRFYGLVVSWGFATLLVFGWCCFRLTMSVQEVLGRKTSNQSMVIWLEGVPMVLAAVLIGIFHPALCMQEALDVLDGKPRTKAEGLHVPKPSVKFDGGKSSETMKAIEPKRSVELSDNAIGRERLKLEEVC